MLSVKIYAQTIKKIFPVLMTILPSFTFSQGNNLNKNNVNSQGIVFVAESNWKAVLYKAKSENKYIFVDVFATWCGPCRLMATETFTDISLGEYVNDKFIAVKLQMDTSKADNDWVKAWYADAKTIGEQYKVDTYPTILFFNSSGKLVHKTVGYKEPKELEDIARGATDPSRQLYTQLEKYRSGKLCIDTYSWLARKMKEIGEKEAANEIAAKYIASLTNKNIYTKENLSFTRDFITSTKDKMFSVFYKNQKKVDGIMEIPYYSQDFVDYLVTKEYIDDPYFKPAAKVKNVVDLDWNKMYKNIGRKYGANYADRVTTSAKVRWYSFKKQWPGFISNKIKYNEVYDRPEFRERNDWYYSLGLNNDAWAIFEHSNDPEQLKIALKWAKLVAEKLPEDATSLDTYANLLYKLGKKDEAITLEDKALSMIPDNKDIKQALEKMKAGLPTWPQQ